MTQDASPAPYLMLRDPDGSMTRLSFDKLPLTIGRSSSNELQVLDPTISRAHASIDRDGVDYVLEDLGSTHGTFVNQVHIERHALQANDRIRLGGAMGHTLTFRSGDEFTMLVGTTGTVTGADADSAELGARQRDNQSLTALLEISKALNSSLRLTDVLEKVMDAVIALTDGERCMMLLGSAVDELEVASRRNLTSEADTSSQYSQSVVGAVYRSGEAQILTDVSEDARFSMQQSIVGLHLRTVMCVPLRLSHFSQETDGADSADGGARILGVLYVDRRSPTRHFGEQDLSLLESFAGHAAIAIDNARLYEEALEKRRLEDDVRVANRLQRGLLLSEFPDLPQFDVHALNVPSRGVGGDYFEFFEPGDGSLGFAVGDVSGKGIPAAMLMATLQAAFLAAVKADQDLSFVCQHVNQFIYERTTPERYATFFVGILDPDGGLQYVNAGHNPALLIGDGETRGLAGGGLPLGLFPDRTYEVQNVTVAAGDTLVTFSDGVTEAINPSEEEFGDNRLIEVSRRHRKDSAHAHNKAILDAVSAFGDGAPQHDDVTSMVVKYNGP